MSRPVNTTTHPRRGSHHPGDSGLTSCAPSGMGVPTVTATRILKGQINGKLGCETPLAMDLFPYVALSKVRAGWPRGAPPQRGVGGLGSVAGGEGPAGLEPEFGHQDSEGGPPGLGVRISAVWRSHRGAESISVPRHTTWTDRCQIAQALPQPTCAGSRPTTRPLV